MAVGASGSLRGREDLQSLSQSSSLRYTHRAWLSYSKTRFDPTVSTDLVLNIQTCLLAIDDAASVFTAMLAALDL